MDRIRLPTGRVVTRATALTLADVPSATCCRRCTTTSPRRRSSPARWPPATGAPASRLPLRHRAQRSARHLHQRAQPGRLVRAIPHRLERPGGAARPDVVPDDDSIFPGDTMVFTGASRRSTTDDQGCGWVGVDVALTVGERRVHLVPGPDRPARFRPTTTPGLAAASAGSPDPEPAMDLDFTPEQDLLRDSVRRTCERHGGLDACASSRTTRSAIPRALERSSRSSACSV